MEKGLIDDYFCKQIKFLNYASSIKTENRVQIARNDHPGRSGRKRAHPGSMATACAVYIRVLQRKIFVKLSGLLYFQGRLRWSGTCCVSRIFDHKIPDLLPKTSDNLSHIRIVFDGQRCPVVMAF